MSKIEVKAMGEYQKVSRMYRRVDDGETVQAVRFVEGENDLPDYVIEVLGQRSRIFGFINTSESGGRAMEPIRSGQWLVEDQCGLFYAEDPSEFAAGYLLLAA